MLDKKVAEKDRFRAYGRLASRVIEVAVEDWKAAKELLAKNPCDLKSKETVLECEEFFASAWYQDLRELAWDDFPEDMKKKLQEFMND
jgi:ABC-type phosphate/phosphonate transport system substrate-binding protein